MKYDILDACSISAFFGFAEELGTHAQAAQFEYLDVIRLVALSCAIGGQLEVAFAVVQ